MKNILLAAAIPIGLGGLAGLLLPLSTLQLVVPVAAVIVIQLILATMMRKQS